MYKFTVNNLLEKPNTYQFSDVSSEMFIEEFMNQRKHFLKGINEQQDEDFSIVIQNIQPLEKNELLKLQKRFEVKKRFFTDTKKDISFITHFSYQLCLYLNKSFCTSLLSTLLKVNDTLTSINNDNFSAFEINLLALSIEQELTFIKRLGNA